MTNRRVLKIHPSDNVAVALEDLFPGDTLIGPGITNGFQVAQRVPFGHKVSLAEIRVGEIVRKYGVPIGLAYGGGPISPGSWVHVDNLCFDYAPGGYSFATNPTPSPTPILGRTWMGYRRPDGRCGTRNLIAVIAAVNCASGAAQMAVQTFDQRILERYSNVDGVIFAQVDGCGIAMDTPDHELMRRALAGIANNPNIAGYIMVDLGCQQGTMKHMEADLVQLGMFDNGSVQYTQPEKLATLSETRTPKLTIQELGGTQATISAIHAAIEEMLPQVNNMRREPIPVSELILALQCGGSDGNSGITANPVLGAACDLIVAHGGTVVLTETTEIAGAEHRLIETAATVEAGQKLVGHLEWWVRYFAMYEAIGIKATFNNNPAQGNKDGGITTSPEKALGAVAKAGTTPLMDVVPYAAPVKGKRGLIIMDGPGTDWVSAFGQIAGGCNLLAFTTGRGSCSGSRIVPVFKLATNTPMYQRMIDDMDLNAGRVIEVGGPSIQELGAYLFERLLETASGQKTCSELHGYHDMDHERWKIGPTV